MAQRTWTNGSGLSLSATNLNALETDVAAKAEANHTHTAATTSAAGFLSAIDKSKLDGIQGVGSNLLTDGNFEIGLTGSYNSVFNGTVALITDATKAHSGLNSVQATVGPTGVSSALVVLFKTVPVMPGRTYRLSAWVKAGIGTGSVYWHGTWTKPDNTTSFLSPSGSGSSLVLPATYTELAFNITVPDGGLGYHKFGPRIYTSGFGVEGNTFFVDDVSVTDITEVVAIARDAAYNATSALNGHMSAADKAKLDAANFANGVSNLMMRNGTGDSNVNELVINAATPSATNRATRKDYVDAQVALAKNIFNVKEYGAIGNGTTNDTAALASAVAAALAVGGTLYWPPGNYLASTSIASLHAVRHTGPGAIKRGTDTFYPAAKGAQANKLYVATTGNDANDGLTSAQPLRTVAYVVGTVLPNYGPLLDGFWTIQVAAGTYTDRAVFSSGFDSVNEITIQGPIVNYPNQPTCKWSEGYNIGAVAFKMSETKAAVTYSNIEFIGYNGTTSSAGIQGSSVEGSVRAVNVWFTDCYWGFTNQDGDGYWVSGVADRCGYLGDTVNTTPKTSRNGNGGAYRGLMHSRHTIGTQGAGTLTLGPKVTNSRSAVFIQESCTGHVDYATIEDCEFGINANVSSRANVDGTSFKRNTMDLKLLGNSHAYISSATTFGTGADESSVKVSPMTGSQITDENRIFTNITQNYSAMMKIADTVFPAQTIQTTTNTVFYTATLAGNLWRDAVNSQNRQKRINLKIYGEFTGTAGTKSVIVRLGTANVTCTFTATEIGVFEAEATVFFTGQATQLLTLKSQRHIGANVRLASNPGTNAMTANTNLTAEASVGVVTDSIIINAVDMSWG